MSEWLAPDDLEDASPLLTSDEVAPGARLGRYEILLPVASGGMARVWAARLQGHRGFSKLVAVKTILPHLALDPEFERMFLDEARIASGVHHPNVCEIYELGEEGEVLYLAMEWVNGDSLQHVLRASGRTEPLEPRIAARIIADACAGLHAAHVLEGEDGAPLNVVHRDVSPQNLLLTIDGNTKMADFGVAKALGQQDPAHPGSLRGKMNYMAPEQISGPSQVDRRGDIFAMGCVLYEATTGRQPFEGGADHLVMRNVIGGAFVLPSKVVKDFPLGLEQIIARALAPHPAQRFATAERMRFALEQWLAKSGSHVVTQADVARVVRARIGARVDRRRERLKQATGASTGEVEAVNVRASRPPRESSPPGGDSARSQSHSGVKPSGSFRASQPPAPDLVRRGYSSDVPMAASSATDLFDRSEFGDRTSSPPPAPPERASGDRIVSPMAESDAPRVGDVNLTNPEIPVLSPPPHSMRAMHDRSATAVVPRTTRPGPLAIAMAVVACVAGGLALGGAIGRRASAVRAGAYAMPEPTTMVAAMPAGSVNSTGNAPANAPAVDATPITFRLTPAEAELTVDGAALAAGVHAIPRPAAGHPVTVYVRADGHDGEMLTIDEHAAADVSVTLARSAPRPPPAAADLAPAAAPAASAGATTLPASVGHPEPMAPRPPSAPPLPANPY